MLNDGGLSAILNVQTIKLHRDAVVVLEDLIAISNMNDEQKEKPSRLSESCRRRHLKPWCKPQWLPGYQSYSGNEVVPNSKNPLNGGFSILL